MRSHRFRILLGSLACAAVSVVGIGASSAQAIEIKGGSVKINTTTSTRQQLNEWIKELANPPARYGLSSAQAKAMVGSIRAALRAGDYADAPAEEVAPAPAPSSAAEVIASDRRETAKRYVLVSSRKAIGASSIGNHDFATELNALAERWQEEARNPTLSNQEWKDFRDESDNLLVRSILDGN